MSPVFFLTASFGGKVLRSQCVVPAGKALFFPILNDQQSGGMPSPTTDAANRSAVNSSVAQLTASSLRLEVDGVNVPDLADLRVNATKFSCVLGKPPNFYTCAGGPSLSGPLNDAYQGGYYVLLAPLPKGSHTIHFQGSASTTPPFSTDITYDPLVVE